MEGKLVPGRVRKLVTELGNGTKFCSAFLRSNQDPSPHHRPAEASIWISPEQQLLPETSSDVQECSIWSGFLPGCPATGLEGCGLKAETLG